MNFEDLQPDTKVEICDTDNRWHSGIVRSVTARSKSGGKVDRYASVQWSRCPGRTTFVHSTDLARVRWPVLAESADVVAQVAEAIGGWYPHQKPTLEQCLSSIKSLHEHRSKLADLLNGPTGARKTAEALEFRAKAAEAKLKTAEEKLAQAPWLELEDLRRQAKVLAEECQIAREARQCFAKSVARALGMTTYSMPDWPDERDVIRVAGERQAGAARLDQVQKLIKGGS